MCRIMPARYDMSVMPQKHSPFIRQHFLSFSHTHTMSSIILRSHNRFTALEISRQLGLNRMKKIKHGRRFGVRIFITKINYRNANEEEAKQTTPTMSWNEVSADKYRQWALELTSLANWHPYNSKASNRQHDASRTQERLRSTDGARA